MRKNIIHAVESLEASVIKNKWFVLAGVSIFLTLGGIFYAIHDVKENVADCFRQSSDIAYSSVRHSGEMTDIYGEKMNASVASGDLAKAYFGMCLVVNGVDARTVPPFEDLFPQMTVSKNFQNESFDVLDSAITEPNTEMDAVE
jgi:hypothetical protein